MKRILLLIKGLNRGGAEQLLVSAAPYLDRSRFAYEVAYLLPTHDAMVASLREAGLQVGCLNGARGVGWIRRLQRVVREQRIDLLHIHSPYAAIGARAALTGRRSPRIVYTEHSVWEGYRRATYWGNLLTFPRNDHVFAVSEHVQASLRYPRSLPLRMPPVEILYHGIDPSALPESPGPDEVRSELGIPEGVPVVGCIANFTPQKAHRFLLEAIALLRRQIPEVRLVLIGAGQLESEVRRHAQNLGLDGSVVFTGSRPDAPRIAACFDVFALSSVQEGLSIGLIEAMALGTPAVVTRAGGLPEVVRNGTEGVVVPPADAQAIAGALRTLLGDSALRRRMGEAARRRALDFDIRKTVRRIEQVYEELLA